jgi:lipopolysaccharide transport system ATP-binding protein
MSDYSIRVQDLGKKYRIGRPERYSTLRDSITRLATAPLRWLRGKRTGEDDGGPSDTIWALRDLAFDLRRGEVLGVIGRNGAGKSTLLKILSRITEPTTGEVEIRGRVGSLLEVGTGFHAELTGRENIFLNGAILGMSRHEIRRKFDAIVSFAGVELFIDTPVKHFSSGMYTRLAFAVAAHLEPEILIVDEVLAVGDSAFQKKCLGKMGEVAREGRTVLFVSHNMAAISHLCSRGLVLRQGILDFLGTAREAVDQYERELQPHQRKQGQCPHLLYRLDPQERMEGNDKEGFITGIEILDGEGQPLPQVRTWDAATVRVHFELKKPVYNLHVMLQLSTLQGVIISVLATNTHLHEPDALGGATYVDCRIPRLPLAAGDYLLGAGLCVPHQLVTGFREDLALLSVQPADVFGCGQPPASPDNLIAFAHDWAVGRVRLNRLAAGFAGSEVANFKNGTL